MNSFLYLLFNYFGGTGGKQNWSKLIVDPDLKRHLYLKATGANKNVVFVSTAWEQLNSCSLRNKWEVNPI